MSIDRWNYVWLCVSYGSTSCDHRKGWTPCSRKGLCANSLFETNTSCSLNITENISWSSSKIVTLLEVFQGKYKIYQVWKLMHAFKVVLKYFVLNSKYLSLNQYLYALMGNNMKAFRFLARCKIKIWMVPLLKGEISIGC